MDKVPTIEQAAALAWDLMKPDDDPHFSGCAKDHQEKLVYHAQSVAASGIANDDFERKVKDVLANPAAAITEIKAKAGLVEPEPVAKPERNDMHSFIVDSIVEPLPPVAEPEPLPVKVAKPKRGK